MKRKNVVTEVTLNCYNCNHEFQHRILGMSSIESSKCHFGECPQCGCDFEISVTRGRSGKTYVTKMNVVFKVWP